ncbi:hypothetical protein BH10BAC5_BH10BAC5_18390 [soil metagenome]
MKILVVIFLMLTSGKIYSQNDSISRAGDIFSMEFMRSNELIKDKDLTISYIDQDSILVLSSNYNTASRQNESKTYRVYIDSIRSFGYKTGTNIGVRIRTGALLGFGAGFILGLIPRKKISLEPSDQNLDLFQSLGLGLLVGLVVAVPGALIGAATGIGSKEYEVVDVSKYNLKKKYNVIKELIQKGIIKNE